MNSSLPKTKKTNKIFENWRYFFGIVEKHDISLYVVCCVIWNTLLIPWQKTPRQLSGSASWNCPTPQQQRIRPQKVDENANTLKPVTGVAIVWYVYNCIYVYIYIYICYVAIKYNFMVWLIWLQQYWHCCQKKLYWCSTSSKSEA